MNFHETKMGQDFFTQQLPELIRAFQDISKALLQQKPAFSVSLPDMDRRDVLSEIYYSNYCPESLRWNKDDSLNQNVLAAETALCERLSDEDFSLFDAYQTAVNIRADDTCCQAFKSGAQLAVQMILAGYAVPAEIQSTPNKKEDVQ